MKFKSLIFVCCFSLFTSAFADNRYVHPSVNSNSNSNASSNEKNAAVKAPQYPGYCEIEIVNASGNDIRVYGVFDDGASLAPFTIYAYERPYYIDLYYYGYCHAGMRNLTIYEKVWSSWYLVFSGYVPVQSTIYVVPYLNNQVKVNIIKK